MGDIQNISTAISPTTDGTDREKNRVAAVFEDVVDY